MRSLATDSRWLPTTRRQISECPLNWLRAFVSLEHRHTASAAISRGAARKTLGDQFSPCAHTRSRTASAGPSRGRELGDAQPVRRGRAPDAAGIAKLTFHDLRHTYGSHLAQSGLDPVGVQRQMGHVRPSITMDLYVHEFETARRREQVSDRLTAALGGLVESDKF
jgi:integrase-like protein